MPEAILNFIKGDEIGSDSDYRDALPVNMYAISRPMFGVQAYMQQFFGLKKIGDGEGVDRGGIWNERFSEHYRVSGNKFISVDKLGNTIILGDVTGSDTVSLPYSFNTQGIVADGKFYTYSASSGFNENTDPDLGSPIDCVWVDGYYFFTDGEFIYHSDINDETSIDPQKFATAEFMPDPSLGLAKTQDNKVMVFGRYSLEFFVNNASENFSFQRLETRAQKIGIVGTHAKAEVGGKWYILGGRKEQSVSMHVVGVGDSKNVSTREIDKIIDKYSEEELSSSVVETFEEDGTTFVIVHLPNETLLFNESIAQEAGVTNAWSILKTDVLGDANYRAKHTVFDPRGPNWVVGDKRDTTIGLIDSFLTTHYDEIVEWIIYSPIMKIESASVDQLEIENISGHTTNDDATVFVSISYDGVTHGMEYTEMYGAPNDYNKRFILRRMGYVRNWLSFKFRGASQSRMAFSRGLIEYG